MKRTVISMILIFVSGVFLFGCAAVQTPATGLIYHDVSAPVGATMATGFSKIGHSSCTSILGIVATGDASIDAAMKNGGIAKIHHVDYNSVGLLGIYATMTTTVYGE